jgi:hypothetical protein
VRLAVASLACVAAACVASPAHARAASAPPAQERPLGLPALTGGFLNLCAQPPDEDALATQAGFTLSMAAVCAAALDDIFGDRAAARRPSGGRNGPTSEKPWRPRPSPAVPPGP